jgi:ataxia telangiectasia mutated family protein
MTPDYYESVYRSLQSFVRHDTAGALASIANARQTVLSGIGLLEGSESTSRSMSNHISKLNVLSSLSVLGEILDGKVSLQNVLQHWGFADEAGIKDFKSLLLSFDEASLDIREQPIAVDSARFRSLRIDLSTKEVLLKILLRRFPQDRDMISQAIASHIYSSCRIYRDIGRPDVARQTLSRMRNLLQVVQSQEMPNQSSIPLMLRLEDAKVMARQLDFDNAITHCKTIVNHLSNAKNLDADFNNVLVRALLLGGCLMAHEHVDAIGTMESFFDRAAKLSHRAHEEDSDPSSLIHATTSYFKLGEFASGIYSSVNARVASEAWKQRKANQIEREKEVAAMQNECAQLEKKYKRSKKQVDVDAFNVASHKLSTLSKEVDLDGREIRNTQDSLKKYLGMAVESHCNALKLCPTTATSIDKHVFKLIGLWFENCQKPDTHNIVNDLLKSNACLIPTYHFVPLIYQIFSRIDENDSSGCFQSTLHKLVVNICAEHPYHGIPQLIALSNSNLANKVEAAKIIIQQLRKNAPSYVSGLIDSYGCLMDSYIDLANLDTNPIPKKQTKGFTFSKYKLKLDGCLSGGRRGSKNLSLSNVPAIISKPPAIRPDGQYGNGCDDPIGTERVVGFESTFELAPSGLHRPAIVICLGSQGGRFKQLVKGDDDLRQDAVMQQVFGTMNNLLKNEGIPGANHMTTAQNSPRQQLKIVTYGITPLSPTTGVLEWVDNTEAFGSFMKSSSNNVDASSRYYPGEWGNTACSALYSADHERKSQEERRRDFDIVCRNHSPGMHWLAQFIFVLYPTDLQVRALQCLVFRFFFIENFAASMEAWHTARTAYTRSCAVNSIGKFLLYLLYLL